MTRLAATRIVRKVRYIGHYCKACELKNPPLLFEGVIRDDEIVWPIIAGYHISYCPHCGLPLSQTIKRKKLEANHE